MTDQQPQPEASESTIAKIQALFAKANATNFAEEAEAYLAKAEELMAKYNLDEAIFKADSNGGKVTEEEIVRASWKINTKGGHAPSRMKAYFPVIWAMGAQGFYSEEKEQRYVDRNMTITIIGQKSVVDGILLFLPAMELTMERLADQESKAATAAAKLDGTLYSNTGCNARRGFMMGFGSGVGDRIRASQEALKEQVKGTTGELVLATRESALDAYMARYHSNLRAGRSRQKHDDTAYQNGKRAGYGFASPNLGSTGQKAIG